mgnify:CR=1 FL=1
MKVILKLGGSLITEKGVKVKDLEDLIENYQNYIRLNLLERLAREIREILDEGNVKLFLVHGAGPYGHQLVKGDRWKELSSDPSVIHEYCAFLNRKVLRALKAAGVEAVSLPVFHFCKVEGGEVLFDDLLKLFKKSLKWYVPVSYGDIVPSNNSFVVVSGDDIALEVGKVWKPDKVVMATDKEGVYDKDPELYPDAKLLKLVPKDQKLRIESGEREDVTGGIVAKVEKLQELAKLGAVCQIINGAKEGNLYKAIVLDEPIGTVIK